MWKILLSIFIFGVIVGPFIAVALGAVALVVAAVLAVLSGLCALLWAGSKGMWRWAQAQPAYAPTPHARAALPEGLPLVAPRYPCQRFAAAIDEPEPATDRDGGGVSPFDEYRRRHQGRGLGRALVLDTRAYGRQEL